MDDLFDRLQNAMEREQRIATCVSVATHYLGFDDLPFHRQIYDIVDGPGLRQRAIIPAPRDHGKSVACAFVLPIKRILNDQNYRILIGQKRAEQAKKSVRLLRQVFEKNTKVIEDFGDIRGRPWEKHMFYVKRTIGGMQAKDPTVEGVGVEGAITGGHFDLIVLDDILDEENTKTETRRAAIDNWLRGTVLPLMEPQTQIIIICTRKHYRDSYGWLLENPFYYHPKCRFDDYGHHNACGFRAITVEPQYDYIWDEEGRTITGVKVKGDYEVLEPALRGIEWLLLKRGEVGDIYFRREYQNDPSGMQGIFFHDEWLGRWVWPHEWNDSYKDSLVDYRILPPIGEMSRYISIDPAIKKGPQNDMFGMAIHGVDSGGHVYLLDTFEEQIEFPEQVDLIRRKAAEVHPRAIIVEDRGYQDALRQQVLAFQNLPIYPMQTTTDKKVRAVAISPYLEMGRVYVHSKQEKFWNEYRQFPSGKNDDLLDAWMLGIEWLMARNIGNIEIALFSTKRDMFYRRAPLR